MSDAAKEVGKRMKYPYTYTAKIAQFPYKFYWTNSWLARYWVYGMFACAPLFWTVGRAVNSPGNVALWKEKERLEELEHAHH